MRFCKYLSFRKGETIFEQGDPAFGFYCLCAGAVKLWRWTHSGRAIEVLNPKALEGLL